MPLIYADRVKETTTTTGTGTYALAGATTGFRSFVSGMGDGNSCQYVVENGTDWEVGAGIITDASPDTLSRERIIASSNAGAAVDWAAGSKNVFCAGTAEHEIIDRRLPLWACDFLTNTITSLAPFWAIAINSGTLPTPNASLTTGSHPGVVRFRSSTSANSGYRITTDNNSMLFAGGEMFEAIINITTLTNLTVRVGYFDSTDESDAVDGAYIEIPSTGAAVLKTANNSTRTTSASIATLVTGTWYRLVIVVNTAATRVDAYIYNDSATQLGTQGNTANIPTASGREFGAQIIATNSGTTATDLLHLDYMGFGQMPTRALTR